MAMQNERESGVGEIERWFHWHPTVLVEEQTKEGDEKPNCTGCGELLSGPCFRCALCNHRLDPKCAYAPYRIGNHPLHPHHHSGFSLRERPPPDSDHVYCCALCKEKRDMFFYECRVRNCPFSLDIKCFSSSSSFKPTLESKLDFHQHPLTLIETPINELEKRFRCAWCHEPLLGAIYFCFHCPSFVFHKKCLDELPAEIQHPSHHLHPLSLEPKNNDFLCKLCQKQHSGYFYSCSLCQFHINIECARPMPVVEHKRHHQHAFTLFWRQGSFTCDACDTEGEYISYICSACCVIVHKDCTKLPRVIRNSRHQHCLFLNYFLQKQETKMKYCKICFKEVKVERGSYSCVKAAGCNYLVHVNCALEDKKLYDVIEQESQCEEICAATQPSIIRVIERNEAGEATKIEHFSHEGHCLVLADKSKMEGTDGNCHGCTLSISDLFYYCSEPKCHFWLHKTCAEFPIIKPHWLHLSGATLESKGIEKCSLCHRWCSGFFYNIGRFFDVCLRCAQVPDIIELEAHQHLLLFDFKCQDRCNGCGSVHGGNGAFKCGKCRFVLDFACLTLPHSALHKFDQHMLYLTYNDDNDYEEHCYCDICETERDRGLWYYNCSICDTTVHPNCVLGNFPFVKEGARRIQLAHYHDFDFFRKVEGYPECSQCHKLCLEEVFKCKEPTCNYIIHAKCWHQV
ncbi:hypothetical protein like AT5G22355 [Hibiscus trionum]|uniref:Phorbol-ester/DAG-type domain-containing protein n=1 Tax=Hibiscus trionum TaxID=183268 RepID=A0A9W7JI86_HIBTR|nr:hypothetical protein like AT5G22355 [Hibiscus trionum]